MATETHAGHTEAPHSGGFPPFAKETFASQLVWLAICFVALYLLISRIAVPRIGGIIDERAKRIEGDFASAQRMKDESEAALAAYEKSLAEARNRAQAIGGEIRDKLHAEGEERRKALEAKLNTQACRRREADRHDQDGGDDQRTWHRGRCRSRDRRAPDRHGAVRRRGGSRGRRRAQGLKEIANVR